MDGGDPPRDATADFERALEALGTEPFVLRLYIAGNSSRSQAAIENVKKICDEYPEGPLRASTSSTSTRTGQRSPRTS